MQIPTTVSHADLKKALEPLHELLGINSKTYFAEPGLFILEDEVRFVAAAYTAAADGEERPRSIPASITGDLPAHPQGTSDPFNSLPVVIGEGEFRQLGYDCVVRVIR